MKTKIILLSFLTLLISCKNAGKIKKQVQSNNTEEQSYEPIEQLSYYPSGIPKIKGTLINKEREGKWYAYFEDGRIKSTNTYVHDNLQGASYVFYKNGQIFYKGKYSKNIKVEKWFYYKEDGKLLKTIEYNYKGEVINEINH